MIGASLAFVSAVLAAAGLTALLPRRRRRSSAPLPRTLRALVRAGAPAVRSARLSAPRELSARIEAAGAPGGLGDGELMAAKAAAALVGMTAAIALAGSAPGRLGSVVLIGSPVAGFLAPDLWLARRAADRARRVRRSLPSMLDLLRVTIEAGMSLPAALAEVGRRARGPLAREWVSLAREAELGIPLEEALRGSVRRFPLPETVSLAATVERALRHGAPLAETLAAQAQDVRASLRRQLQEEAARAGPKIQLVVALLLVPSVLLLVAAALVSALLPAAGG